jgi:hypothetical protein
VAIRRVALDAAMARAAPRAATTSVDEVPDPMRIRSAVPLLILVVVVGAALFAGLRTEEYARVTSPDGRFYAVATYRAYQACVPRMPGGGGDKPGFIEVFRRDGVSCGRADVVMVNELTSIRWDADEASLPVEAVWSLRDCGRDR